MTPLDTCLTQIVPLIQAGGENALAAAEVHIERLVAAAPADTEATAIVLSELQAKVARQTTASPLRSDVLDLIGSRIVTLLETGTLGPA